MAKHPLFSFAGVFALGICLARFVNISFFALYFSGLIALILGFIFLKKARLYFFIVHIFFFLLGGIFYLNSTILPSDHISKLGFIKNQTVFVKGIIASQPTTKSSTPFNRSSFILVAKEIKLLDSWHKISGRVLVNCYRPHDLSFADYVILEGKLIEVPNFHLSRRLSLRQHLLSKGINFIFSVKKQNLIKRIDKNRANPILLISFRAKKAMQNIISKSLPALEAGILEAFILGERSNLPKEINDLFVQTGTVHILAISGFNVGIVIFILLILLKALRINRNIRFGLTIIFIIIYAIITGSQPSVIRASIMAIVILVGILLQRESDIYNSVAFAAMIILMLSPKTIFDVGYQLSFLSVLSIVWMTERIEKPILQIFNSKSRILTWVVRSLSVSLAAWLGVLGLVVYYFNIISPITVLANLFIVPFSSLIVALGFCLVFLGSIFPAIAFIFANSVKLCLDVLVYGVWIFHKLPLAFFYLPAIRLYEVLAYYLIIFLVFSLINTRPETAD